MAGTYDIIMVNGQARYRLNKNFIAEKHIPEAVKKVLTEHNVVDENGLIIVDNKIPDAQKPTEENQKELDAEKSQPAKLARVDRKEGDAQTDEPGESAPTETVEPETPAAAPPTPPAAGQPPVPAEAQATPPAPAEPTPSPEPAVAAQTPAVDDSANETNTEEEKSDEETAPAPTDAPAPAVGVAPDEDEEEPEPAPIPEPTEQKPAPRTRRPAAKVVEPAFKSKVPQSKPGMGFPRVNGKTVDLFDGKTPHTHIKNVGGQMVPLSDESFRTKTDFQILTKLQELGYQILDFDEAEREEAMAGVSDSGTGKMLLEEDETDDDIKLG